MPPIYLYSRSEVFDKWVNGSDPSLDEAIKFAVNQKDEGFNPATDIPAFQKLIAVHDTNFKNKGPRITTMDEDLLVEQFDLLLGCSQHLHTCCT